MRILIAEDSVLLRAGLTRLLVDAGEDVVAAVGDADELLDVVERHQPDLAVVDVRMPPTTPTTGSGPRSQIRAALARGRHPRAVASTSRSATPPSCSPATRAGSATCSRTASPTCADFLDAVRRVGEGGTALDPEVVAQLLARSRRRDPLDRLSPREREVLGLMAEGRSNAAIAAALVVSDGAVEKHVSNIFTKLDLPPAEHDHRRVLAVLRWLES